MIGTVPRLSGSPGTTSSRLRCPVGRGAPPRTESVFVEQAAREAATAPVLEGDPEANRLLEEARRHIYHWPDTFPGFAAGLTVIEADREWHGCVVAPQSRKLQIHLPADAPLGWVRHQTEELVAHREAPSVSRMKSTTGVAWGEPHSLYGPQVVFLGDRMQSWYRIRDRKITQIGRSYGGQTFVIHIDEHQAWEGQFAARSYTAVYRDEADRLSRVETYLDHYVPVEGLLLPEERRFTLIEEARTTTRVLRFSELRLLPPYVGEEAGR